MARVSSLDEARRYVTELFLPGARLVEYVRGRYGRLAATLAHGGRLYVVLFKRDFLRSYERLFPHERGKGPGQSVNVGVLKYAKDRGAKIVCVMEDGSVYALDAGKWFDYFLRRGTTRFTAKEGSQEVSVPVRLMEKWEPRGETLDRFAL